MTLRTLLVSGLIAAAISLVVEAQVLAASKCLQTSIRPNGKQFHIVVANACAAIPIVVLMRQRESKVGAGVAPVAPKQARLVNVRVFGGKTSQERLGFAKDNLKRKEFLVLNQATFTKVCGDVTMLSREQAASCFLKAYGHDQ